MLETVIAVPINEAMKASKGSKEIKFSKYMNLTFHTVLKFTFKVKESVIKFLLRVK